MRITVFAPAALAAAMLLSLPAIGPDRPGAHGGHVADPAKAAAPAVDPDKAYLLNGNSRPRPPNCAARSRPARPTWKSCWPPSRRRSGHKKLAGDIAALRGQLAEQTVLASACATPRKPARPSARPCTSAAAMTA